MPLPAAEHARVQRQSRAYRTALARQHLRAYGEAKAWCDHFGATIRRDDYGGGLLFTVSLPGFWPGTARTLPLAVQSVAFNLVTRVRSGATHGPRGAKLDRLRELLEAWEEGPRGDA